MQYERDLEWERQAKQLAVQLDMPFDLTRIVCMRSFGSTSNALARCHAVPRIMQKALGMPGHYVIEIVSENFDELSNTEKTKTIIHELMHIPKSMGGEFKTTRVRLLGVDTPEVATEKRKAMYYGAVASAFTKEMVLGQRVRVELAGRNNTRGRYGRLLAYVFVAETGEMLNEALLRNGRAYADPRFAHPRKATFAALEARARQSNTGLWKAVRPEQYPYWKRKRKMAARVPSSAQSVTGRRPVSQRTR